MIIRSYLNVIEEIWFWTKRLLKIVRIRIDKSLLGERMNDVSVRMLQTRQGFDKLILLPLSIL